MKKTNLVIAIVFLLAILPLVSAQVTLNTPASGSNWTTTINFNCTKAIADSPINATNATLWYNASGGAVGTMLTGSTILNDSLDDIYFYLSGTSVLSLSDLRTYNFSCKADNGTAQVFSPGRTGVTIDNTNPVITFDVKQSKINPREVIDAKCSYSDATSGLNGSQYFNIVNPNSVTTTITASGNYEQIFGDTTKTPGDYVITCYAADYSGNTNTQTSTVKVTSLGYSQDYVVTGSKGIDLSNIPKWIWIIAIIGVIYWLSQKKKN